MGRHRSCYIIVIWTALLLAGCGELTPPGERSERSETYTVRADDTLYSIAWGYGLDYRDVAAWNHITPPYLIHKGEILVMTPPPQRWTKPPVSQPPATSPPQKSQSKSRPQSATAQSPKTKPRQLTTTKSVGEQKKMRTSSGRALEKPVSAPKTVMSTWRWPTEGKVVARFDLDSGKKGIDITGRSEQPIFSAAAGDVVYSGSGLLGYGKLVIIKHDDVYLSAYGHNSQLLVKEGDKVAAGQKIAKMGISPKDGAMLHFEIRKEGKPVDPSRYLPTKN